MERVVYMCLVFCGLVCTAQGLTLNITTKFMSGDVLFLWTGTSPEYDVMITRDNKVDRWVRVTDTQYTVKDALLYDSIGINVRLPGDPTNNILEYTVSKVQRNVGESLNISWTAPFFPLAGVYSIYHTDKVNRSIIQVTSGGATLDKTQYEYHSRPYASTNITFEIRDITLDDAGYYNGGINPEAAWNGGGVILIVHDKPQIQGNLDITVSDIAELICSTKSAIAPDYYARLFPSSYKWFVNNTELVGETRETLMFLVTGYHKYNQYSCTARDELEPIRSDTVRINPLFCSNNTYGLHWALPCDNCSNRQQCNHVTVHCPLGCAEGYHGEKCDTVCSNNTYGLYCTLPCGNCSNGQQCNHVTGDCPRGCAEGYHGKKCDAKLKLVYVNDRLGSAFFGLLAPFMLSLLCNVWCIIREIRRKHHHHQRQQNKENENCCPNTTQDQVHVYDDLKANSAYQELGEVSKPSKYDTLK